MCNQRRRRCVLLQIYMPGKKEFQERKLQSNGVQQKAQRESETGKILPTNRTCKMDERKGRCADAQLCSATTDPSTLVSCCPFASSGCCGCILCQDRLPVGAYQQTRRACSLGWGTFALWIRNVIQGMLNISNCIGSMYVHATVQHPSLRWRWRWWLHSVQTDMQA